MNNAITSPPVPENEPVFSYGPQTEERTKLQQALSELKAKQIEICPIIGGQRVCTGNTFTLQAPHDHSCELAVVHRAGADEVKQAIKAASEAHHVWRQMDWSDRAAIFLKAADLLAGPWRMLLNGATMLGQSKNPHQAEIDAACELIDFFRFNVHFAAQIYKEQPNNSPGLWNRLQYRPLEGFVFAVPPFNFTSISGNLPTAPALMGNVVLWKPATGALLASYFILKLLEEAGLPPGVINFLPGKGPAIGDPATASPKLSGLHFTGSVATFNHLWQQIGNNIGRYNSYPRIVGETGGKDFVIAHESADVDELVTAIIRGGYEYQGQKCSAVSRTYIPDTLWPLVRQKLEEQIAALSVGPVEDFSNFINAVINRQAFDKITSYLQHAANSSQAEVIIGGGFSDENGFFVQPTVIKTSDPQYKSMQEEIFGPVVSTYVYPAKRFEETLTLVDESTPYGLTGAIFARDRQAIVQATNHLEHAAGNFYINDKPTGAVVGQQPFGGGRKSGTNDKAGSALNLMRWVTARSIKENFTPATHYMYPFLQPDPSTNKSAANQTNTNP